MQLLTTFTFHGFNFTCNFNISFPRTVAIKSGLHQSKSFLLSFQHCTMNGLQGSLCWLPQMHQHSLGPVDGLHNWLGPRPLYPSLRRQVTSPTSLCPPSSQWWTWGQQQSNLSSIGWRLPMACWPDVLSRAGTEDRRVNIIGKIDLRIQCTISTWKRTDPPSYRIKPILVQVLWRICFIAKHLPPDSVFLLAVVDMIIITLFFLLRLALPMHHPIWPPSGPLTSSSPLLTTALASPPDP